MYTIKVLEAFHNPFNDFSRILEIQKVSITRWFLDSISGNSVEHGPAWRNDSAFTARSKARKTSEQW